jgi:hypothetical protein
MVGREMSSETLPPREKDISIPKIIGVASQQSRGFVEQRLRWPLRDELTVVSDSGEWVQPTQMQLQV